MKVLFGLKANSYDQLSCIEIGSSATPEKIRNSMIEDFLRMHKASPPITSVNEATCCEFISAIIYGVASIFDGTVKVYIQYEVSGSHGKEPIDWVIKMGDTIISVCVDWIITKVQSGIRDRNDNGDGNLVEVFLCLPMPTHLPINYLSLSRDDLVRSIEKLFGQIKWVFDQQKSSLIDEKQKENVSDHTLVPSAKSSEEKETDAFLNKGLIQEINSSIKEKHILSAVTEILVNQVHPNALAERNEDLYKTTCDAEKKAIEANREETLRWYFYTREFKRMYKDFMISNKIGDKKAKGQIYDFIIKQLPDTKCKTLCRQTQKALRIDNLFKKIGMDKFQYIKTYSADTISKFTDPQIQIIIDHFTEKSNMEFIDKAEYKEQNNDQNNVLEVLLLAKLTLTASILLAHVFAKSPNGNSSDDSKEASPSNLLEAKNDYYKMLLEDCMKDCMYFDSAFQSVKKMNEEMLEDSDDSNNDGYGGYNIYGEHDKGCYYHNGRYERKVSPMMSPIISPVTI
ncbi:hypothetical protein C1645_817813 [Glomus cerebriforme]|uniref:Uncharacterized protein n=1 Tax=Glomus cerebriforme TaxID=658196 RepID=A0A397T8J5_9GLOM|nr:hypothetical protein C1645_817813 [Glomus cerebriforme]